MAAFAINTPGVFLSTDQRGRDEEWYFIDTHGAQLRQLV